MGNEPKIEFRKLPEKERITGLVSGINNYFGKALTLYAMRTGRHYTLYELAMEVENFLGENLPLDRSTPYSYCRKSLRPIGAVVKSSVRKQGKWVKTYAKTEDGDIYGDPSIARFLLLADGLGISLNKMNGGTSTSGSVRRGYVVARLLEELSDREVHTENELMKKIGISSNTTLKYSMENLQDSGFVNFRSVKCDQFGESESGFSVAELVDKAKLEEYIENPSKLREKVLNKREQFTNFGYLRRVLELKKESLNRKDLVDELGIDKFKSSSCIATLCDLGLYRYRDFKGSVIQSSAKITDKGLKAFELAYYPMLRAARNLDSRYVSQEYREILERLGGQINELFRHEKERYMKEKHSHKPDETEERNRIVMCVARNIGKEIFRMKDTREELRRNNIDIKRAAVSTIFLRLVESGELEKVSKGVYRLV